MARGPLTLPAGMTPRLLSRAVAAAYCGVSIGLFEQSVPVLPLRCFGSRKLWDARALDRWLDQQSGLVDDSRSRPSAAERLNGDQSARR